MIKIYSQDTKESHQKLTPYPSVFEIFESDDHSDLLPISLGEVV